MFRSAALALIAALTALPVCCPTRCAGQDDAWYEDGSEYYEGPSATPYDDEGREDGDDDWYTPFSYSAKPRDEEDPAWYDTADERIRQHRMAELRIRVTDADGRPLPGARVHVNMLEHRFGFGSAVAAQFVTGTDADARAYRRLIPRLFNKVTIESDLKWPHWEDPENRRLAVRTLRWLHDLGMPVRGHCLVWGAWSWLPFDLYDLRDDHEALAHRVTAHLEEQMSALRGQLVEWDVVNEPYLCDVLTTRLGREAMVDWYRVVHRLDPEARLFINEYGIITGWESTQSAYEENIRFLLDNGAPLHGIGLQGHFAWTLPAASEIYAVIDRYAAFELPIQITELDIDIEDDDTQAEYLETVMTAAFSHPAVSDIILWGFWEGRHWRPQAAFYRLDWTPRPSALMWSHLVFERWWTNENTLADEQGHASVRAFLGTHRISARHGDRLTTIEVELAPGGQNVQLVLE